MLLPFSDEPSTLISIIVSDCQNNFTTRRAWGLVVAIPDEPVRYNVIIMNRGQQVFSGSFDSLDEMMTRYSDLVVGNDEMTQQSLFFIANLIDSSSKKRAVFQRSHRFFGLVFAAGFQRFRYRNQEPYETYITYDLYVTPGLIGMIALFNGMQSSLSMVYDRETGSMKLLMTAPISRRLLLTYKLLATASISTLQTYIFIGIAMLYGVDLPWLGLLSGLPTIFIASYFIALIGLILASQIKETENFAGIMNFVISLRFSYRVPSTLCGKSAIQARWSDTGGF